MATRKPTTGSAPTRRTVNPDPSGIDTGMATPPLNRQPENPGTSYDSYLAYATAVAHLWSVQTGVAKTVQDVISAGGPYAYDPSQSTAAYRNMAQSVTSNTGPGGWMGAGGGGGGAGGVSSPDTPPAEATPQALIDNGISSLTEYGFGQNRYTPGPPVGGYPNAAPAPGGYQAPAIGGNTPAAGAGGTAAVSTAGLSTAQRDAWAYLRGILDTYGLGSLSPFVITELTAGRSQDEIALDLQQTPEFKTAFPEIEARRKAGLPPISPGEIVSYRNNAIQMMRAAGLPAGFYDTPQDLQQFIGNDVSLSELNDRIQAAKDATYNIDPQAQARLFQEFGLAPGSGGLAAIFLDDQRAVPLLQRQLNAARIGGAADQTGYAGVNNATALDLAQAGVTADQARQGFAALGHERELFTGLPGERADTIGQGAQLAAQFLGNTDANERIERRRRSRLATFADGGGYASGSKGISGLGQADSA